MYFKINCRIININNNKLTISINDNESLNRINNILSYCKKKGDNIKLPKNNEYYIININNNTKYNIKKVNYNNINDLIGIELIISGFTKYYYFTSNESYKTEIDKDLDDDIEKKPKKIIVRGYNLIATKIITN